MDRDNPARPARADRVEGATASNNPDVGQPSGQVQGPFHDIDDAGVEEILHDFMNHLRRGVFVLDGGAFILYANAAAQQLASERDPICVVDGCLTLSHQASQSILDGFIRAQSGDMTTTVLIQLHRRRDGSTLLGQLTRTQEDNGGPPRFIVCFHDLARASLLTPDVIRTAYSLTSAQARVARLMYQGLHTREIAVALNLSHNTVRAHTKEIFRRCHVRSRAELIRIFTLGPR